MYYYVHQQVICFNPNPMQPQLATLDEVLTSHATAARIAVFAMHAVTIKKLEAFFDKLEDRVRLWPVNKRDEKANAIRDACDKLVDNKLSVSEFLAVMTEQIESPPPAGSEANLADTVGTLYKQEKILRVL